MKVSMVFLENFKPYFGLNKIDLSTNDPKNVILIGGINGQGKTSFLISLVWCLYGEKISTIDEVFKKEVKGNYTQYLNRTLNWTAKDNGKTKFSVSIIFDEVELSEGITDTAGKLVQIEVKREYDIDLGDEELTIKVDGDILELVKDDEEKRLFINDYIIPLESAKFIFFNAERIASIADLSIKEQGGFLNDALGKILGLSTYDNLIEDLENSRNDLKKQSADNIILNQIDANQGAIDLKKAQIAELLIQLDDIEEQLNKQQQDISSYEGFLIKHGVNPSNINLTDLHQQKDKLENSKAVVSDRLYELIEILPYAISAGKLQELTAQLELEEEYYTKKYTKESIEEKAEELVENLFNKEPFPDDDIKFKQKTFYYNKAKQIITQTLLSGDDPSDLHLDIEHGLSKSNIASIKSLFQTVVYKSKDVYEQAFSEYNKIENELNDIIRTIRKIEGNLQDEIINDYKLQKEKAEREKDKLLLLKGAKEGEIANRLNPEILSLEDKNKNLLNKVSIAKGIQEDINYISKLISTLTEFVKKQKEEKCESLGKTVTKELGRLMHRKDFIKRVSVTILPDNLGLEVNLFDFKNERIPQEVLSEGEKQVYISALMKAILDESIIDYPVFIDTPLGRLDLEHRDNLMEFYYPELSNQVVIFAQNAEIDGKRMERMKNHLSKTYLLKNSGNKTEILEGYFN